MKRLAVFVSGGGSNFKAIHAKILSGEIDAFVGLVVTSKGNCAAADYARKQNIKVLTFPKPGMSDDDLLTELSGASVDFIILAGYVKMISANVVRNYTNRILNIHPALLPEFGGRGYYGRKVHEAVLQANQKESGATVHIVDEKYDHGAIIDQVRVPVMDEDTPESLAARILEQEHILYPEVVAKLCRGEIRTVQD